MAGDTGQSTRAGQGGSDKFAAAATPTGSERRVAFRATVDRAVEIRLVDAFGGTSGPPIIARLADLSASGIGLRVSRPIAPGREILLTPPSVSASASAVNPLLYRVVRCRPLGQSQFHVGACFVRKPIERAAS